MSSRKSRKSRKILPRPTKGALGNYSTKKSAKSRRSDLKKDVKKLGYKSTMLDLNLVATMNKNTNPAVSKKMRQDMKWMRKEYSRKSKK